MRKYFIWANACEQRSLEMNYISYKMNENGFMISTLAEAEIVLVNTCCVSEYAYKESKNYITKINKLYPKKKIIIYGCLPGIERDFIDQDNILCFCVSEKEKLLTTLQCDKKIDYTLATRISIDGKISNIKQGEREKFDAAKRGKKIILCDGCLNQCTYCSIRYSTGVLKSRREEEIISNWNATIRQGETVMLMGGDTGAYGLDIGSSLPILIKKLSELSDRNQIYLHDLNIRWMISYLNEFCEAIQQPNNAVVSLTLPIQSGSTNILGKMNRHYNREDIIKCFNSIRKVNPFIALGTHIIVGFPTETEEDFRETIDTLEDITPDFISCFPYSENKYVGSFALYPKVSKAIINSRIDYLKYRFGNNIKIYH